MRTLTIYSLYFLRFLKARLAYRTDFVVSLISGALVAASGLLYILVLVDGKVIPDLKGWSREEVLFIYGYSMLATGLFGIISPNLFNFADRYIIQGQFDRILLRPLNTLCQVLFEAFNLEALGNLLVGMAVFVYAKRKLSMTFDLPDFIWLFASSISGAVILLSVFVILSSMSFHFEDRFGIAPPFYNLITFARYPLPIYNNVIQFILRWVVPFAFVAFYPATYFFSKKGFEFFCYFTPVMALLSLSIAILCWRFGVSRYESTGS